MPLPSCWQAPAAGWQRPCSTGGGETDGGACSSRDGDRGSDGDGGNLRRFDTAEGRGGCESSKGRPQTARTATPANSIPNNGAAPAIGPGERNGGRPDRYPCPGVRPTGVRRREGSGAKSLGPGRKLRLGDLGKVSRLNWRHWPFWAMAVCPPLPQASRRPSLHSDWRHWPTIPAMTHALLGNWFERSGRSIVISPHQMPGVVEEIYATTALIS